MVLVHYSNQHDRRGHPYYFQSEKDEWRLWEEPEYPKATRCHFTEQASMARFQWELKQRAELIAPPILREDYFQHLLTKNL